MNPLNVAKGIGLSKKWSRAFSHNLVRLLAIYRFLRMPYDIIRNGSSPTPHIISTFAQRSVINLGFPETIAYH